ncbi:MAG: hypothetical protein Ta2A_15590 [Treponemataceae bacterium]|nr:MAG: hypothetical protein Ta2A_15590 [Treponemataceae bacterium]
MTKKHTIIVVAAVFLAVAIFSISCGNAFVYHTLRNENATSFYNETRLDVLRFSLSDSSVRYVKVEDEDVFEFYADNGFEHVRVIPIPRNKDSVVEPEEVWLEDPMPGAKTEVHFTVYSKNMAYKREYLVRWAATHEYYVSSREKDVDIQHGSDWTADGQTRYTPLRTITRAAAEIKENEKAGSAIKLLYTYYFHTRPIDGTEEYGIMGHAPGANNENELISIHDSGLYPIKIQGHDGSAWPLSFDAPFRRNSAAPSYHLRGPSAGLGQAGIIGIHGSSYMIFERIYILPPTIRSVVDTPTDTAHMTNEPLWGTSITISEFNKTPLNASTFAINANPYTYNNSLFEADGAVLTVGEGSTLILGGSFGIKRRVDTTDEREIDGHTAYLSYMPGNSTTSVDKIILTGAGTLSAMGGASTSSITDTVAVPNVTYSTEYFIPYVAIRVKGGGKLSLQGVSGDGAPTWLDMKYGTIIVEPGGQIEISGRISVDKIVLISGSYKGQIVRPFIRAKTTVSAPVIGFSDGTRQAFNTVWKAPDGQGNGFVNVVLAKDSNNAQWRTTDPIVKGDYIKDNAAFWDSLSSGSKTLVLDGSPEGLTGQFRLRTVDGIGPFPPSHGVNGGWAPYNSANPDSMHLNSNY